MGILDDLLSRRPQRGLLTLTANQLASPLDAREGQLGAVGNAWGGASTEISTTVYSPELGGWVNIPTLVEGQTKIPGLLGYAPMDDSDWDEARKNALAAALSRVKAGESLPSYRSALDASLAAGFRSSSKDLFRD